MKYFMYAKRRSKELSARIWEELSELKRYARSLYKGNAEDAIQDSYLHILRNYDETRNEGLRNYTIRVLNTIYMTGSKDVLDETVLDIRTSEISKERFDESNEFDLVNAKLTVSESNLQRCIGCILPRYVEDFKFFDNLAVKDKTLDYDDLLQLFNDKTIAAAFGKLNMEYKETLRKLYLERKNFKRVFRDYSVNKYQESFDSSIEFECVIGDVLLYKGKGNSIKVNKKIYKVNLSVMVNRLMYMLKESLSAEIEGYTLWSSLTGYLSMDEKDIKEHFEREVVGKLITNHNLKTLAYEQGKAWYISSMKELSDHLVIGLPGKRKFSVELEKVVTKRVGA